MIKNLARKFVLCLRCWNPRWFPNPFYSPAQAAFARLSRAQESFLATVVSETANLLADVFEALADSFSDAIQPEDIHCARCGAVIPVGEEEFCWYCAGPLCSPCWEEFGHCGHPEADAINARIAASVEDPGHGDA